MLDPEAAHVRTDHVSNHPVGRSFRELTTHWKHVTYEANCPRSGVVNLTFRVSASLERSQDCVKHAEAVEGEHGLYDNAEAESVKCI